MYRSSGGIWLLQHALAALILIVAFAGCKKNSEINVAGTITLDHQPLANAEVRFIPVSGGAMVGSGQTDHNGRFTLTSAQRGKGIATGEYKVVISKRKRPDGAGSDPNSPSIDLNVTESLPAIWSDESQTTLTVTINRDKRPYDFKLTTPGDPKMYAKPK